MAVTKKERDKKNRDEARARREQAQRERRQQVDEHRLARLETKFNGDLPKPAVSKKKFVPKRNDQCRCGSGKKFKKCCGAPLTSIKIA